jgi:hypothetical protein
MHCFYRYLNFRKCWRLVYLWTFRLQAIQTLCDVPYRAG